ncbi:ribonuclease H-like domain-containing protein [Tanacetum coccineum]
MSHFGRSGPPDISDTYSLLILNISFRTTADDLFPLFDKYGKVVDIFIPKDRSFVNETTVIGKVVIRNDWRLHVDLRLFVTKYSDEAQKAVDRLDVIEEGSLRSLTLPGAGAEVVVLDEAPRDQRSSYRSRAVAISPDYDRVRVGKPFDDEPMEQESPPLVLAELSRHALLHWIKSPASRSHHQNAVLSPNAGFSLIQSSFTAPAEVGGLIKRNGKITLDSELGLTYLSQAPKLDLCHLDDSSRSEMHSRFIISLFAMAILISSLDASNPLHFHANDSNGTPLISIKLTGVENYRIWASVIKNYATMIEIDGLIGFTLLQKINSFKQGGLPVFEYYHKLNSIWREFDILTKLPDCVCEARAELIDHGKLMRLMQFLMGLDDVYQPIRSSLLTREILPEVRDAFLIIAKEESYRGISSSSVKAEKPQASVFVARTNDNKRNNNNSNWNNGNSSGNGNRGNYNNLLCKNCGLKGHTIERCFEIIGYPPGFKRNPNLKVSNNFNNNKNNNADVKTNDLFQKLMSLLNDKSGSAAHTNMAGNLRLNNDVVLFDVLVIPEYCVSLLSVHKLIKDSKLSVSFDETKCVIQDLKREKVLGTGSESAGLYVFYANCDKLAVLKLLKNSLNLSNLDHNSPCEVCHKAKQTRDSFPISDHKSVALGDLIHLDVWGPYKVVSREGFSPNDDEEGPSGRDGNVHQPVPDSRNHPGQWYANHTLLRGENYCFVTNLNKSIEPSSFEEALKDINWINAMNEELHALYENNT